MRGSGYRQPANWSAIRRFILERDEHRCYLCGDDASTVDHVVSVSQDGTHDEANLAAICQPCHAAKSEAERRAGYARRRPRVSRERPREPHPGATGGG